MIDEFTLAALFAIVIGGAVFLGFPIFVVFGVFCQRLTVRSLLILTTIYGVVFGGLVILGRIVN
jgi:hypothetical protein